MPASFTVMTYNVHSCVGADGRADPLRIARVIAAQDADIVALQELDLGLARTGLSDQAKEIAGHLMMGYHFHSCLKIEEGHYGNAVLSRFPMEMKKAAELPTLPYRKGIEKRGALWVETEIAGRKVQVITTHLGLNRQERTAQAETLLSAEWLNSPNCRPPFVLCGDLNTTPLSKIYRWFAGPLRDAAGHARGRRRTYPGRLPALRLDYIFSSPDVVIREVFVPGDRLARTASDHLPVAVRMEVR